MRHIQPWVFFPAVLIVVAGVAYSVYDNDAAQALFVAIRDVFTETVGWFYVLSLGVFLVAAVLIAASDWGSIRLGPDDSEPEYSYFSWFSMLFAAGMGVGLMFFSVAEPLTHFDRPNFGSEPRSVEAAQEAVLISFFHWGIHVWALYGIVGLSLAFFTFRHGLPLTMRSALYPLIGDRVNGWIGHLVDLAAVVGTLFGIATSLGLGVAQINAGLNAIFGIGVSTELQLGLIAGITLVATLSVSAGLDAGIQNLSRLNVVLAIGLMLFVFIAGPTIFLLLAFVQNVGSYLEEFARLTFNVDAYGSQDWISGWTLFYWGWWISWSPFVGMFIARISRGRTIREFLFGVLLIPTLFTFFWLTVYGNSALELALAGTGGGLVEAATNDAATAIFAFLENLPFAAITSVVAIILVTVFFVTSSDSGSLVIDIITSGGNLNPPVWQRVFWALVEGVVAAVLVASGGLIALQAASLMAALPFVIVLFLALIGLLKALSNETLRRKGVRSAAQLPVEGSAVSWRARLRLMFTRPSPSEVNAWIETVVVPALQEVAPEMEKQGLSASVERESDRAWITLDHGDHPEFVYGAETKPYEGSDEPGTDAQADAESAYARAEVFLREGGQHYDIFGYTKNQVIRDLLRQYERHRQWIHHMVHAN